MQRHLINYMLVAESLFSVPPAKREPLNVAQISHALFSAAGWCLKIILIKKEMICISVSNPKFSHSSSFFPLYFGAAGQTRTQGASPIM